MQLNGEVHYQWDKLNLLFQPYTGTSIQFCRRRGRVRLPIAARSRRPEAKASAAVQFSGANIYGFQVGPGELKVHLANGVLRADPLEVTCNQGRVALQPELRMDRQPMEFRLSAGTLASQIQLDQAACRSALKYVVPVLASVTQSQGQFSIQLDGCRIPIGDLNQAEIAGRIIVHSATMSPGPLVAAVGFAGGGVSLAGSHRARVGDPVPHDRRTDLSPGAGAGVPGRHDADLRLGRPGRFVEADGGNVGAAERGFPATP